MPKYRITAPDGGTYEITAPEGATEAQALEYAKANYNKAASQPKTQRPKSFGDAGAMLLGAGQSIPITDEIGAALGTLVSKPVLEVREAITGDQAPSMGELYSRELEKTRGQIKQAAEDNPLEYYGGMIAGSVGTGLLGAGAKGTTVLANSLRSGGLPMRALKGAAAGATSGGLYGFGAGEGGLDERLATAGEGATAGLVLGGALPVVGATVRGILGKGAEKIATKGTQLIGTRTQEIQRSNLPKPMQKVYDSLRRDIPDDAEFQRTLNSYMSSKGKALIETGGKSTALRAEKAARYEDANVAASDFFAGKVSESGDKMKAALAKAVSKETNYSDALDTVVSAGREKAAPIYNKAFQANQSVQSPLVDRILQTPEGRASLKEAVKNMQNEMSLVAKPDKELTALVRELSDLDMATTTGSGVAKGLKLKTLDYVKRGMDDTYRRAIRAGDEAEARRILGLKQGLVSELDKLDKTGLYAKARNASGDYLSARNAMEAGRSFFKEDPELVAKMYAGFSKAEKDAYRVGLVKEARDAIEKGTNVFADGTGQNIAKAFGNTATQRRLKSILKPDEYSALMKEAVATDKIYKLRNQVLGNSRTALRLTDDAMDSESQGLIQDVVARGWRGAAGKRVEQFVQKFFDGLNAKTAKEVADILYETDPKKKYQIVKQLSNEFRNAPSQLRKTEAGQKLRAFYQADDLIKRAKLPLAGTPTSGSLSGAIAMPPVIAGESPTRITVNPAMQGREGAPDVNLPQIAPQSSIAPDFYQKVAQAESSGNPLAKSDTSSASGLYQFTDQTWRDTVKKYGQQYGITKDMKNNPYAQEAMVKHLTEENRNALVPALGREPTHGELYVAHFMGAPKAAKLLDMRGSREIAARVFPAEAKANRPIFFDGSRPRTVQEVIAILERKVS